MKAQTPLHRCLQISVQVLTYGRYLCSYVKLTQKLMFALSYVKFSETHNWDLLSK